MNDVGDLYPLRFEPIYQYRVWGGRRLADVLQMPLPGHGPIGEAWVLSDRADNLSLVANGPLKGTSIAELFERSAQQLMGRLAGRFARFPLLLKFLDARTTLSVQVHPSDLQTAYLPPGESGKTEAWVVLEAGPAAVVYAGLEPGTTADDLRQAVAHKTVAQRLAHLTPKAGDAIFLKAGTVHSLGDLVVFEVQQNSDVTLRLYDWDRVDAKTGKHRTLNVEEALACIDFSRAPVSPVVSIIEEVNWVRRERLFHCEQFELSRLRTSSQFSIGAPGAPRVLVCVEGEGQLEHAGVAHRFTRGDVLLLPAVVGACLCRTQGALCLLDLSIPEVSSS